MTVISHGRENGKAVMAQWSRRLSSLKWSTRGRAASAQGPGNGSPAVDSPSGHQGDSQRKWINKEMHDWGSGWQIQSVDGFGSIPGPISHGDKT